MAKVGHFCQNRQKAPRPQKPPVASSFYLSQFDLVQIWLQVKFDFEAKFDLDSSNLTKSKFDFESQNWLSKIAVLGDFRPKIARLGRFLGLLPQITEKCPRRALFGPENRRFRRFFGSKISALSRNFRAAPSRFPKSARVGHFSDPKNFALKAKFLGL